MNTTQNEPLIQTVRGMHDALPGKSEKIAGLEAVARRVFSLFGYREIRTPVLEFVSLYERAIGEATDIVEKEMFTLKDRGERLLCLRPEGTAGVVRSYIENALDKKSSVAKLYYIGPMFRAERPQAGRTREFSQIGSEYFGNESPAADAETIQLLTEILRAAGVGAFTVQVNSIGCGECRPQYQERLLAYLRGRVSELCDDCKKRIEKNPLRVLDCKIDKDKLKDAPKPLDTLCAACRAHHDQVLRLLKAGQVAFEIVPGLVRGLDYYSRTVFEIYAAGKTGSQDALAAGGRYDRLVEDLGGPKTPAVGFALGVERVLNAVEQQSPETATERKGGIFVASIGDGSIEKCFEILSELRKNGLPADAVLGKQSLKSQMRLADSLGLQFCAIIGEDEIRDSVVTVRDLTTKSQEKVPMAELIGYLKAKAS